MDYAPYASAGAHKLLSDNRDRYIAQSAATRNGEVAPLPPPYEYEQMMDGPPEPVTSYADRRGL